MQFPEMGRPATVELIVSMVIGPNTVTGSFQDVAVKDIEAESNEDVEILRPNFFQGIGGEPMNKLFSTGATSSVSIPESRSLQSTLASGSFAGFIRASRRR